jgi:SNF2 family DNA or RNA helicase
LEDAVKPTAKISYTPQEGLKVEAGYAVDNKDTLISSSELKRSKDGKYTRIGNNFVPVVEPQGNIKKFLEKIITRLLPNEIPEFFQRDLVLIKKEFNAVLTDLASQIRVVTDKFEPQISVKKTPMGWLEFDIQYNAHGVNLLHNSLKEIAKSDIEFIPIDEFTWVKVDREQINQTEKKLQELEASVIESGYRVPVSEFASLEEFIAEIGGRAELNNAYKEFINQLTGFNANPEFSLSEPFEKHLINNRFQIRPYQRAGVHWLDWLRRNHLHGILADDMGLGKTLQSLINLRLAYEDSKTQQHSLIIAPKSVLLHWERELNRVFYFIRSCVYHGPNRRKNLLKSSQPIIFITTYDTVVRDIDELVRVPFYFLILDEATRIKNPDANRSRAIKSLNAAHRLALSGTPVENRPTELWSLYDFLMRGHLGRHGTFVREFEEQIMAGDQQASNRLGRRIKPFILRRKKEDVAKDLPEKIIMTEYVNLTDEQREQYSKLIEMAKEFRTAIRNNEKVNYTTSILPILTKLKQICDHPGLVTKRTDPILGRSEKFDWIVEKINEIIEKNEKVVIFSHFLDMLSLIEAVITKANYPYIRIDGGTNNRQTLIDKFNNGNAKIALLSIMAAGYGINLTSANHVIHADRWWNPATEDQATDRVHRIGQTKTVFVYHILTEGTLEEKIDVLLSNKKGMSDQIMNAAVEGQRQWSKEELLELLRPLD